MINPFGFVLTVGLFKAFEYLKKYNPYEKQPSLNFDLRKYARFVEQNNLKGDQITEAVMEQFVVNKT